MHFSNCPGLHGNLLGHFNGVDLLAQHIIGYGCGFQNIVFVGLVVMPLVNGSKLERDKRILKEEKFQ